MLRDSWACKLRCRCGKHVSLRHEKKKRWCVKSRVGVDPKINTQLDRVQKSRTRKYACFGNIAAFLSRNRSDKGDRLNQLSEWIVGGFIDLSDWPYNRRLRCYSLFSDINPRDFLTAHISCFSLRRQIVPRFYHALLSIDLRDPFESARS